MPTITDGGENRFYVAFDQGGMWLNRADLEQLVTDGARILGLNLIPLTPPPPVQFDIQGVGSRTGYLKVLKAHEGGYALPNPIPIIKLFRDVFKGSGLYEAKHTIVDGERYPTDSDGYAEFYDKLKERGLDCPMVFQPV